MSKTTKGRAVVPSELALHRQIRQLTGLLGRNTALICATWKGHTPVVEQLIAAGAGLDVQDNEG
jgi:ankyrin repeat protein